MGPIYSHTGTTAQKKVRSYQSAMERSAADSTEIKRLLREALTDKVDAREMFMKGIDYSYYYEER